VELYSASRSGLHAPVHCEEAVAVGTMQALEPDDAIVATYREQATHWVRACRGPIMAEMYWPGRGLLRAVAGVDALVRRRHSLLVAVTRSSAGVCLLRSGLALADKLTGRERVTACFFGDRRGRRKASFTSA